jgi:hypothetical protein
MFRSRVQSIILGVGTVLVHRSEPAFREGIETFTFSFANQPFFKHTYKRLYVRTCLNSNIIE